MSNNREYYSEYSGKKVDSLLDKIDKLNPSNYATKSEVKEVKNKVTQLETDIESISPTPMVSVTYAELKTLRDNGELIPGMQYRITDYMTTTTQENTRSAGHQFDVIVVADSSHTLNEKARARLHDGDTYFSDKGAKLEAWQIWYCLDNDKTRFGWAIDFAFLRSGQVFTWNGKDNDNSGSLMYEWEASDGAIVYTQTLTPQVGESTYDDVGNEDGIVENIINGKGVIYRMIDEWNNDCPYDFKNIQYLHSVYIANRILQFAEDSTKTWLYTFSCIKWDRETKANIEGIHDGSIVSPFGYQDDEEYSNTFVCNKIGRYYVTYDGDEEYQKSGVCMLSNIVMLGVVEIGFGEWLSRASCCANNEIGDQAHNVRLSCDNYFNRIGHRCYNVLFDIGCCSNIMRDDCANVKLYEYNKSHHFESRCRNIVVDVHGYSINIGTECFKITIGMYTSFVNIGNRCQNINTENIRNMEYIIFGDGCLNNTFYSTDDDSSPVKNYHIDGCVNGEEIDLWRNRAYNSYITYKSDGELRELCLGDMSVS